ncbi:MAG TPA: SufD family Fe-S cluster assembly protein [Steroidobacteraceae bacterium]|jgi:Fe-S cluster assembly protein SufD|nr:SufD family Fe-S cluster assembly protein [Steroidobacteraceae bacterium]
MSAVPAAATSRREQTLARVLREFETVAAELPEDTVPQSTRQQAARELARLGWPQARDELWRYANLRALERIASFIPARRHTGPAQRAADASATASASAALAGLPALPAGVERLVFIDGIQIATNARQQAPSSLAPSAAGWPPEQRLGLLGDMFAQDAAVLRIAGQAAVEVVFLTSERASGAAVYPRLCLELAADARLTLIERHLGETREPTLVSVTVRAELARGAQLTHYRLQQCGAHVLFDDSLQAALQERASYEVRQIGIGALAARTSARVRLAGRAAALGWQALAVGQGEQVHDTSLAVVHAAPDTRTEEIFRGIADARSRVAFSGHIHIEAGAPGAQARQSLRGLIEGANAEIDLRPRLQIDVDEVSAQHGATTGRLDENLLFYLLSRGLPPRQARALLKWAFLGDVLRSIELPELRAQAEQAAAGQLPDAAALAELAVASGSGT